MLYQKRVTLPILALQRIEVTLDTGHTDAECLIQMPCRLEASEYLFTAWVAVSALSREFHWCEHLFGIDPGWLDPPKVIATLKSQLDTQWQMYDKPFPAIWSVMPNVMLHTDITHE